MRICHHPISSPSHYMAYDVQPITVTRYLGFCMGNVVKYVLRAPYKDNPVQDLQKALQYLEWEKESPLNMVQRPHMSQVMAVKENLADLQSSLDAATPENATMEAVINQTKFFLIDVHDYLFVQTSVATLKDMENTICTIFGLYELSAKSKQSLKVPETEIRCRYIDCYGRDDLSGTGICHIQGSNPRNPHCSSYRQICTHCGGEGLEPSQNADKEQSRADFIRAELATVNDILATISENDIIGRMSFEGRKKKLEAELQQAAKEV